MHVNIKSIYLIKANNVYNLTKHKLEPDSENKKDQKEFLQVYYYILYLSCFLISSNVKRQTLQILFYQNPIRLAI